MPRWCTAPRTIGPVCRDALPLYTSRLTNLCGPTLKNAFEGALSMERVTFSSIYGVPAMFSTIFRKTLLIAAIVAMPALARAGQPFDAKAFQASQAAGKSILVYVTAPWCPTCKQQRPIVQQIEKERQDLIVYEVDFDTAKDVLKRFHVQYQSTLIVFRGSKEVARSTGETDPTVIRSLIAKAF